MKQCTVTVFLNTTDGSERMEQVVRVTGFEIADGILLLTTETSVVGYKEFVSYVIEEDDEDSE